MLASNAGKWSDKAYISLVNEIFNDDLDYIEVDQSSTTFWFFRQEDANFFYLFYWEQLSSPLIRVKWRGTENFRTGFSIVIVK